MINAKSTLVLFLMLFAYLHSAYHICILLWHLTLSNRQHIFSWLAFLFYFRNVAITFETVLCRLLTKLSNSNQGQETQLEEYVYISMTDHSRSFSLQRGNLFLILKPFLSIFAPLGEKFSSEFPNLRNLTQIPALLITLELKPLLLLLCQREALSRFSLLL